MEHKTNVMRELDKLKINYNHYCYANTDAISGIEVASALNQNPEMVFKTLVTVGKSKKYYVFMLPVAKELDLKKAAKAVGYIHGGCSPIGMKKFFTTTIDTSAQNFNTIIFSAGKIGYQVEMSLDNLSKIIKFTLADIVE